MMRYRLAAALAAALVLSSCGSGSDPDDASGDSGGSTTTSLYVAADGITARASTVSEVLQLPTPIVLAHASGENEHPHSTMFGYADAVEDGVDVLDIDIQMTKDGVLVVHHDDTVDRTTDGMGKVSEMTFEEIRALDNAYWYTDECTCTDADEGDYIYRGIRTGEVSPPDGYVPDDFAISKFSDLAERFPSFVLNIEIKGSYPESVPSAQALADEIERLDRIDSVIVTAFDDDLANAFSEMLPEVEITPGLGASTDYVLAEVLPEDGRRILQLPKEYEGIDVVNEELMGRVHADGLYLWIWPNQRELENLDSYLNFIDIGVDGINAAAPSQAVEARDTTN